MCISTYVHKRQMGAICGGSSEEFNGDHGLLDRVVWYRKKLGGVSFFSFWLKMFLTVASGLVAVIAAKKKRKSQVFEENMESVMKCWAYWQYSWWYRFQILFKREKKWDVGFQGEIGLRGFKRVSVSNATPSLWLASTLLAEPKLVEPPQLNVACHTAQTTTINFR